VLSLGLAGRTTVAAGLTIIGLVAVASPIETAKKWLIAFGKTAAARAK
jgi:hypothetical protein